MAVFIEIGVILLLVLLNGFFAMAELAVVSSRRARLQQRADKGDNGAVAALRLAENPDRFLSTVQIGITLIGILAGAFGGATLSASLAAILEPYLGASSGAVATLVVVLFITYLSLVIGELVPKRLALQNPEAIACRVARPMTTASQLARPVVALLIPSSNLLLRLLGISPSTGPSVTEEEIRQLIMEGTQAGVFEAAEGHMMERVIRLGDQRVDDLMTPRTEVVWLDVTDGPDEHWRTICANHHSQYPVIEGSPDRVLGIAATKDLWPEAMGEPIAVRPATRPALFVPETLLALTLLDTFRESGERVAIVTDEYGGTQGLISITDVLRVIVGAVAAEAADEPGAVRRDDGSWLVDGGLSVEEMSDIVGVALPPEEDRADYQTVGGFVMAQLGRVPRAGETFAWQGFGFEVMDMDGRRVDKVLVTPPFRAVKDTTA
ncbi:MAG: hemolysin family protein [Anaerolineae bacterium]